MSDSRRVSSVSLPSRTIARSSSSRQTETRGSNASSRSDEFGADPPMLEAKLNRKRAEGDLQLLANRFEYRITYVT